jgi:predicted outer membrane repeat protein
MKLRNRYFGKIAAGFFIAALLLLIGKDVKADGNWGGFKTAIENPQPIAVNLNDYIDPASKTLTWAADGRVIGNKTFNGLIGDNFAILDGEGLPYRHGLGFFLNNWPIQDGLRSDFYGNFEFKRFDMALFLSDVSPISLTISFRNSAVQFTQNKTTIESRGTRGGAAIYALYGEINFTNSTASFRENTATEINDFGGGGAIHAEKTNINFNNSVVNFTSNTELQQAAQPLEGGGGAIYLLDSKINFNNSIVNFTTNTSFVGGAIFADNRNSHLNFSNSRVNFTSNTALESAGAIYIQGTAQRGDINFSNSIVNFISNKAINNNGGALLIINADIAFTNSTAAFIQNESITGGAIYAQGAKISFINTDVFFADNGDKALFLTGSELIISGNFIFAPNADNDIYFENHSVIAFIPETSKTIRFKGKFDPASSPQGTGKINKSGYGTVVFDKDTPIILPKADFFIAQGEARFEKITTGNSTHSFKNFRISSAGYLSIEVDFENLTASYFQTDSFAIDEGASLLVITNNENIGFDAVGSSVPIASATYVRGDFGYASQNVFGGDKYTYSFHWEGSYPRYGILTLTHVSEDPHVDPFMPPPHVDPDERISQSLDFLSPVFIANIIRASAISDNEAIYSNVKEDAWIAAQAGAGSLADKDYKNFKNSAAGAKAGWSVIKKNSFVGGIFIGFASRAYKQGNNKATANDIDFGAYGSFELLQNMTLDGFLGYGLQTVKAEGGAKSEFDANVIKLGAKAEYDAGFIRHFIGFEGAMVNTGDIDLQVDETGETMDAASYARFSTQIGSKIIRQLGRATWFGQAYIDFLLAGGDPQYNAAPYYKDDQARTHREKSRSINAASENPAYLGFGAGFSLPISTAVDVFANAQIKTNAHYFGYQSNVGAAFKF